MARPDVSTSTMRSSPAACLVDACWTVPFVAAFSGFWLSIPLINSGVFYVFFIDEMNATREAASWPKSIILVVVQLTGLLVGALQHKVPIITVLLVGAFLCPVSIIASAFAPNITWISVTYGLCYGVCLGLMQVATSIYIVLYFDQYRSVAIGIMFAIAALAGVVGPSLLMVLSSAYGLKGTFIVTGSLMLNVIPLTLMLRNPRPITWSVCRHFSKTNQPENGVIRLAHNTTVVTGSCNLGDTFCQSSEDVERRVDDNLGDKKVLTTRKAAPGYGAILPPVLPQSQSTSPEVSENNNTILLHIFSLLKKPSFYVLLTAGLAADFTLPVVNSTMADYGRDNGMPSEQAAQLLTILHFGAMCGHVIIPLVGDKLKCARCTIAALTCALLAVCFLIMPQIHSSASLFAVAFVAGLQIGYILTIKPVLVADYLGVRSLALSWGLIGAISLPVAFGEPEIVGTFRDKWGSYDNLYRTCGAIDLFAALLLAGQAWFDARTSKH